MDSRDVQRSTAILAKDLYDYYRAVLPMFNVEVSIDADDKDVGHVKLLLGEQVFAELTVKTHAVDGLNVH